MSKLINLYVYINPKVPIYIHLQLYIAAILLSNVQQIHLVYNEFSLLCVGGECRLCETRKVNFSMDHLWHDVYYKMFCMLILHIGGVMVPRESHDKVIHFVNLILMPLYWIWKSEKIYSNRLMNGSGCCVFWNFWQHLLFIFIYL